MKTFQNFNQGHGYVCPICGTDENKEVILIPIAGTEEGNLMEAAQVHSECLQNNLVILTKEGENPVIATACSSPYQKR